MKNYIALIIFLFLVSNCQSVAQVSKHDGFWDWFIGKPGVYNSFKILDEPGAGVIVGKRHPYYLWFRTPEIIFNPQGGLYYPDMIVEDREDGKLYNTSEMSDIKDESKRQRIFNNRIALFLKLDMGLIDYLISYRDFIDPNGNLTSCFPFRYVVFPFYPIYSFLNTGKYIYYPIHDVVKTVMIPVAAVYYTVKAFDDNDEEEPEK
ncbi:MAG: hypothetical protein H7A23_13185 [Leptospiraceae bacterium]|nr:hypothetical protein [Leptospiraceae bacterium]